jgi:CheY-like chemotaxis protein
MASPDHNSIDTLPPIVLLVDQHADILAAYAACFEASGLWVATSADPVEALDAVQELRPDLLITDHFDDPDFNLVQTIKQRVPPRLPIILLSGRPLPDVPLAARQGADLCLEKPVQPETLLDSSRLLLERVRGLRTRGEREPARGTPVASAPLPVQLPEVSPRDRRCPQCAAPLEWIERGRLYGLEYDYYRWCQRGCGLYCYERQGRKWVKLA